MITNKKKSVKLLFLFLIMTAMFSLDMQSDNQIPIDKSKGLTIAYESVGRIVGEGDNQYFQCLGNGTIPCTVNVTIPNWNDN